MTFILHFKDNMLAIVKRTKHIIDHAPPFFRLCRLFLVSIRHIPNDKLTLKQRIKKADQQSLVLFLTENFLRSALCDFGYTWYQ